MKTLILLIATDSTSSVGSMSQGANALRVTLGPCTVIDDEKTPVPQSPMSDPFSDGSSKEANGGTVNPVYNGHSQKDGKLVFKTDYRLMQVKSVAEGEHSVG